MTISDATLPLAGQDSGRSAISMHTFDIQIEPEMMRRAWNAWFLNGRRIGRLLLAFGLLLLPVLMELKRGALGVVSVACLVVVGFTTLIYVAVYFLGLRRAHEKLASVADGKVSYTLTEETIAAASSLGSMALVWSAIAEVRRYQDLVLIGFRGAAYSTIPAAQIPAEALCFLVDRAKAGGAKITNM